MPDFLRVWSVYLVQGNGVVYDNDGVGDVEKANTVVEDV